MPLTPDPDYMPERTADRFGTIVRCRDNQGRVINITVHAIGLRRLGNARGIDGNEIDRDVPYYIQELQGAVIREAGEFYDAQVEPKPRSLAIGRDGVWAM